MYWTRYGANVSRTANELVKQWRATGPIAWCEGPFGWIDLDGASLRLTPWQRACLSAWEAHMDTVTTLAISNVKKTGKTLLNAILLGWRWLALPGEHFAVGNDLDQSAGRQFAMIADMVHRHPYLERNCKVGRSEIMFVPTGSTIKALSVDAAGNAGSNHMTASHTEAWGIIYEVGIRAYEELTPPPGRMYGLPALRIADSYAGYEGESTTWHALVDRGLAGEQVPGDWPIYRNGPLLLFHAESEDAQARCFRGTSEEAQTYYDDQRGTLRAGAFQRLHLNQRAAGAEAFITGDEWDAITNQNLTQLSQTRDIPLFVGLDLAVKGDDAAMVAVMADGPNRARVAWHRTWHTSKRRELDLTVVADALRAQARAYHIISIFYDPSQAQLLAQLLRAEGLPMREVPQTLGELGPRGTALWEAIRDKRLTVYKSEDLRRAALNAVAKEVPQGLHLMKMKSGRKVDTLVALSFALPAALGAGNAAPPGMMAAAIGNTLAVNRYGILRGAGDPRRASLYGEMGREHNRRWRRRLEQRQHG